MKAVRVQYTVQPEFVEQNKKNIEAVMQALKDHPIEGMYYSTYQLPEGNSFMHVNVAQSAEILSQLNQVEAFNQFRMALKQSGPISPPNAEDLSFVGASWEI